MAPEITAEFVWSHIPKRPRESNKGSFGAVLAVAGSACYRGAASLTVEGQFSLPVERIREGWAATIPAALAS